MLITTKVNLKGEVISQQIEESEFDEIEEAKLWARILMDRREVDKQ